MFLEQLRLDGRVVMVVGAGGDGHGTASCVAAAEAGADVVAVDLDAQALPAVEARVKSLGRRCLPVVADVTRKEEVERAVAAALAFGPLHGLVNVVGGIPRMCSLLETSEELFDQALTLNLRYAFLTCQAVAQAMVERGIRGSIVNVSSVSAAPSAPSHGPYGAAKAALNALGGTMALEWSAHGIRVNAVAPGRMHVPRHARAAGGDLSYEQAIATVVPSAETPLGREGTAADVAGAVLYLLSDLSAYVTGQVLVVDGGLQVKSTLTGEAVRQL
ncbi:MAG TPA: SDR family NAD(P)-dependent oxidoreductase [Ramlibacter sp.]|nr:SDR family NAD(P)-dependent oxidoreductase [Ramlibacter sp.]